LIDNPFVLRYVTYKRRKTLKRTILLFILAFLLVFVAVFPVGAQEKPQGKAPVFLISVKSIINPATAKFITDSIDEAVKQGGQCLIIQLDTPGGLMDSMKSIIDKILTSTIPVVVYVAPRGARAASAGVFITYSAHIAVMAPVTHIGAAHPVSVGSQGKEDKTMTDKVVNDAVSYIKTIAKSRGRNVNWAEKAVRTSVSITEEEALKLNVIDFISPDLDDLLARIDGKVIKLDAGSRTLQTKGVKPKNLEMSWRDRLLDTISNPTIAYILLMLGIYGIFFELSNPGAILPGVVGGIFIILAFFALQMLPVNYAGLALILFAIILFIAEIKVISHGVLAIGGVISLLMGSIMLFQSPDEYMRVSLSVIIPAVLVSAAFFIFAVTMAVRARVSKPTTGREGLVGEVGIASTPITPEGKVAVHGEFWNAVSDQPIEKGDKIQIIGTVDLKVKVKKIE
jgi:membrane-bound serine protease (ClpP class)